MHPAKLLKKYGCWNKCDKAVKLLKLSAPAAASWHSTLLGEVSQHDMTLYCTVLCNLCDLHFKDQFEHACTCEETTFHTHRWRVPSVPFWQLDMHCTVLCNLCDVVYVLKLQFEHAHEETTFHTPRWTVPTWHLDNLTCTSTCTSTL